MFRQPELSESGRRVLIAVMLALFVAYGATYLSITATRLAADPIGDFFWMWSSAHFIVEHPVALVYDPAALHSAQVAMGMPLQAEYPFPYPPVFLLALWPLGHLPFWPAFAVAIASSFLLYLWATLGRDWRPLPLVWTLVAPMTTIGLVSGQSGFLMSALLAGGFRLVPSRPVLAGVLFGLLTYKPQMGLLIPIALIAAGRWRTIAGAAATFVLLVLATSLAFGPAIWPAWFENVIGYSRQFAAESGEIVHLMPTVFEAVKGLGTSPGLAWVGQGIATGFAAATVWRCFRLGPNPLAAATLFAAAFLATPHAFVYDMPIVATAVLWVVADEGRRGPVFTLVEIGILLMTVVAPITMPANVPFPLALLSLVLFVGMAARRCRQRLPLPRPSPPSEQLNSSAAEFL